MIQLLNEKTYKDPRGKFKSRYLKVNKNDKYKIKDKDGVYNPISYTVNHKIGKDITVEGDIRTYYHNDYISNNNHKMHIDIELYVNCRLGGVTITAEGSMCKVNDIYSVDFNIESLIESLGKIDQSLLGSEYAEEVKDSVHAMEFDESLGFKFRYEFDTDDEDDELDRLAQEMRDGDEESYSNLRYNNLR